MGYWSNEHITGEAGSVWGDYPADIFGGAVDRAVRCFVADMGRAPSLAEMQAGFDMAMGSFVEECEKAVENAAKFEGFGYMEMNCDLCGVFVQICADDADRVWLGYPLHCDRCTDPNVDYGVGR